MRKGIMLAHPYDPRRVKNWPERVLVQRKYNGHRCRALCTERGATLFSSEANFISSMPHIKEELNSLMITGVHLDGELYCHGMSRQDIQSIVNRRDPHPDHAAISYYVYDIINHEHNEARDHQLYGLLAKKPDHIIKVETEILTIPTALALVSEFVAEGYEGVILRNPQGYYEEKRSKNLLKYKPFFKDTYNVLRLLEAIDIYGFPKDMLGAFEVTDPEGNIFCVGAGRLDHAKRYELWQEWKFNPMLFLGSKVEVRYPEKSDQRIPLQAVVTQFIRG